MKILAVFAFLTIPIIIFSQESDPVKALSIFDQLTGTWKNNGDKTITTEKWKRISPDTFEGINYVQNKNEDAPIFSESLRILSMKGEVFYLAKVDHNEMPVPFKLVTVSNDKFVFENQNHDFPQRMTYSFYSPDSLSVNARGYENNNIKEFTLSFKRIK